MEIAEASGAPTGANGNFRQISAILGKAYMGGFFQLITEICERL
jgi:hypothetical protein